MRKRDVNGHNITPVVGGYGISVSIVWRKDQRSHVAYATLFHDSDGFQQALLTVGEEGALNVFSERVDEVEALGNELSEEVRYDRLAGKRLPVMNAKGVSITEAHKGLEVSPPKSRPENPPRPVIRR